MKNTILMLTLTLATVAASAQVQRDPFARPIFAVASKSASEAMVPPVPPQLRAIMYEPGKSLVNIDGRILAVGDTFADYSLTAIGERSATLTRRGARLVLVLDQESSK
ncbi:MAG: hypothetical protein M3Y65_21285 [Pseudomonadota bacterium]|nr:hypothetical protein [Pseudomonadota bacterium]